MKIFSHENWGSNRDLNRTLLESRSDILLSHQHDWLVFIQTLRSRTDDILLISSLVSQQLALSIIKLFC
jgi:hypothetical protein